MLIPSPLFRANSSEITQRGFSLVEIAIVMVIIAILITAVGIPLATQVDQQRNVETQKQLEQIKEAIYGYAMANGRLPCPATVAGLMAFNLQTLMELVQSK
jgi:prepilin-type N-terminal cleavage/methylation domain-containing protein